MATVNVIGRLIVITEEETVHIRSKDQLRKRRRLRIQSLQ
ncbi:hypothetical protein CCACVL1_30442 [Corchorus capsularis]|uniref:Uncharacterized protein n=1 Tax=Corchorus capsularis TaxID=210143 RepID=A0A1R3FX96_COCAP|nr:hypothetical protein CCACVL1_30442 [Corchorus capsularis]